MRQCPTASDTLLVAAAPYRAIGTVLLNLIATECHPPRRGRTAPAPPFQPRRKEGCGTGRSVSDLINVAVPEALREDALDLKAFKKRKKEPARPFENIFEDMKRDGLL